MHFLPLQLACRWRTLKRFFFSDSKLKPNASPETKQYFLGSKAVVKTTEHAWAKNLKIIVWEIFGKWKHGRQLWRWMEDDFPFQLGDWSLVSVSGLEKMAIYDSEKPARLLHFYHPSINVLSILGPKYWMTKTSWKKHTDQFPRFPRWMVRHNTKLKRIVAKESLDLPLKLITSFASSIAV